MQATPEHAILRGLAAKGSFTRAVVAGLGLTTSLLAAPEFVQLHAADGQRSFSGRPVAVVALDKGVVRIAREQGGELDCPLTAFAEPDRSQLKRWMDRVANDPQAILNQRLLAAANPAVLFIGNSYSFQVPEVFARIAKGEGWDVLVEQATVGGWTLAQHAESRDTLAKLASRRWTVVVVQEQSQVPAFPPAQRDARMLPPLKRLVAEIGRTGACAALYQTWGRRDGDRDNAAAFPDDTFAAMHERLGASFRIALQTAPALTGVPVGEAWAARMKVGRGAALYNPQDGSHPSAQGNYLAAAVFYSTFFNAPVRKVPDNIDDAGALNILAAKLGCRQLPAYPLPGE